MVQHKSRAIILMTNQLKFLSVYSLLILKTITNQSIDTFTSNTAELINKSIVSSIHDQRLISEINLELLLLLQKGDQLTCYMIDQPMRGGSGLSHADVIISCFSASDPAAGHAPLPICGKIRV